MLATLAIFALLMGLAAPAISSLSLAGKLSQSGDQVTGLLGLARTTAMAHNSLAAVVIATDPASPLSHRAVTIMELRPRQDGAPLASADWRQTASWEVLPPGVLVDSDPATSRLNAHTDEAGVPGVPSPALPRPGFGSETVREFRYLVFLPNGSLLSGNPGGFRLTEGVLAPGGTSATDLRPGANGPANYYEITVLASTGRTLVARP